MANRRLSARLDVITESATLKLNALVQSMKADGVDVINLSAGEPDFAPPEEAKRAAIEAVEKNQSKYAPVPGMPELRQLVADKTNRQQPDVAKDQPWEAADVVVSNGGKHALYNTFQALLNEGDEVLIFAPFWLTYPESVKLAGGTPKFVKTTAETGFRVTPEQLKEAIGPKTKAVIFNSPSNPTGSMYSHDEYAALGEVLKEHENVWVISDEIYDRIVLGDTPFASFLNAAPYLRDRCVTSNGMSKSAAMTGWRIGWTVGPRDFTKGVTRLQGQSTSGINTLAQWASIASLKLPESEFADNVTAFRKRRDLALEILGKSGKLKLIPPQGAFYAFVGVEDCLKEGEDALGFAERLLQEAKVAVVPGTPFGEPHYVRLSFATDDRTLQEGCERIVRYLEGQS